MSKVKWEQLPKEIQQRMLECQVEQGFPKDETVFKECIESGKTLKGFEWDATNEEEDFWEEILDNGNINHFYTLYPKTHQKVSVMFWAVFEAASKAKFDVLETFDEEKIAEDFYDWIIEAADEHKKEYKETAVMLNGGIIR